MEADEDIKRVPPSLSLSPAKLSLITIAIITLIQTSALSNFSSGFLLSRVSLSHQTTNHQNNYHHITPTHSKLILILIDALRYDFILPNQNHTNINNQQQQPLNLSLPAKLTQTQPNHSTLFHFLADPPTTTLQRLKALTTGTLPTFIDFSSNFASTNLGIQEDNWLSQLYRANKTIAFAGDDTWLKLLGTQFFHPNLTWPYESFNVEDLNTVDDGVKLNLFRTLGILPKNNNNPLPHWDVLIAHFLGLDHAGHRFGASHPSIQSKLIEYDQFLQEIVDTLDPNTLLVVLGDHGMDSKGDHGGDSLSEVSTALWLYSKYHPLLIDQPLPTWALDQHHDWIDLPTLGLTRSVAQIDLVPTLSLLLGLPIPFSSLGLIIPEFFFRPNPSSSPTQTLLRSVELNSHQLLNFVERYALASHDLLPHLPQLRKLYTQANQLSVERHPLPETFQAHRTFARSLLSTSRTIWAKFVPSLMLLGILTMALSLLVSSKLLACIQYSSFHSHAPIRTVLRAGLLKAILGLVFGGLCFWIDIIPEISLSSSLLTGTSLGISLGILTHQPAQEFDTSLKLPSLTTLFKLIPVILHGISLGSNSYTIWEDRVVLYLLSFSVLLPVLIQAFRAPKRALQNRLIFFGLLFALSIRLISLSTVCREEHHDQCSVTFYANSTSSNAPNWVMSLMIPLAIALPIVPAWFLGISDSYRGPASFYFGGLWRLILLCGTQYWITDYILSHQGLSLTSALIDTGSSVKLLVARVAIVLSVLSGTVVWFILPVCIDVSRVEPEEKSVEHQNQEKPRLLVIGFANVYGSSYLMFLAAVFGILFLVTQPTGQLVLAIGLVAILSLIEINDSLIDASGLHDSFQKAIHHVTHQNTPSNELQKKDQRIQTSDLNMLIGLYFLGYLIFFGTGHQATFASIQWKSAFIALSSANFTLSPLLVFLNSFSGFLFVALALPLLRLWKFSPIINLGDRKQVDDGHHQDQTQPNQNQPLRKLESELLESQLKFLNIHTFNTLFNMIFIYYLRRHLMVWKIFSPRFMLSSFVLLLFHFAFLILFNPLAFWCVRLKVRRTFGIQYLF